jgi:hypothetical protein
VTGGIEACYLYDGMEWEKGQDLICQAGYLSVHALARVRGCAQLARLRDKAGREAGSCSAWSVTSRMLPECAGLHVR